MNTHEQIRSSLSRSPRGVTHVHLIYLSTVVVLSVAFALFAVSTWHATQDTFGREIDHVNRLFRQTTEAVLVHHESILRVLGRRLEEAGALSDPENGRHLIEQMLAINTEMAGFGLARPDGQLLLVSSIPAGSALPNLSDRAVSGEGLREALNGRRMVVGRTYYFPLLSRWLIPLRLALRDADGEPALVMTAGVNIDSPAAMWNAIQVKPGMRLTLMRDDGYAQLVLPTGASGREPIYAEPVSGYSPTVEDGFTRDPWLEQAMAKAVRLNRFPLTVITSYENETIIDEYLGRMGLPSLLFAVAMLFGWGIFRYLRHNQQEYESDLLHRATHDALTGLPNRVLLEDRIQQDTARARRNKRLVAVMYIDLDQFKRVNDTFGHKAGDQLLCACARRLADSLRDGDTVGRLGGDEFLLILPDLSHVQQARALAARVLDEFNRPFTVGKRELFSTASVGVALFPDDGEGTDSLLKNADTALYRAKDEGRNSFCFFEQRHNEATARRIEVENALRFALARDELRVVYQPKGSGESLAWRGVEALLRWHNAELGEVSPMEFIPVAEETGMIDAVGWFVMQTALHDLQRIRAIDPDFNMAVNVSVRQFRNPTFIPRLLEHLQASGIPPQLIELEVTESIMAEAEPQLEILRDAGLRLAIDDFGTGFSCLSYLKRLPVTTLKLDREFVRDLETDSADKALVTAMIAVARELDLETVAEGVETEGQLNFLQAQRCSQIQGYLLGRPMPIEDLLHQLAVRERTTA